MAAYEPQKKKLKLSDREATIFDSFKFNEQAVLDLTRVITGIEDGFDNFKARSLKIEATNSRNIENFSNASVATTPHKSNGQSVVTAIGCFYQDGIQVLRQYIKYNAYLVPTKKSPRKALEKLLQFLDDLTVSQSKRTKIGEENDCSWAVYLAENLFSKLAVGSHYIIDKHYQKDVQAVKREMTEGEFGDTSFGCVNAWHGSVDIYMDNPDVTMPDVQQEDSNDGNDSAVIVKTLWDFHTEKQRDQMLAQAIVFSFLQRKLDKEKKNKLKGMMIPSIVVNAEKVIVHFYDSDNDILWESADRCLFDESGKFDSQTVVFLWLVLNYKWFCSGTTEELEQFKADFHPEVEDRLSVYQNNVQRGVQRLPVKEDHEWFQGTKPGQYTQFLRHNLDFGEKL